MTVIDFYHSATDRLAVVARLLAKEAPRTPVRVLTPDAATTTRLDGALWSTVSTSFVPHCRMDSPLAAATPVWIDHRPEHAGPANVLVNLCAEPPPFFSRFERLVEVVDAADVEAGRQRFRFYRERGYELRAHDVREWS